MKCPRIISSYFFQKTCYHGNHIMHSVATQKSKAIVLLRERVGEIFSNSYISCYKERSSKYASYKKFCRADQTKKLLFDYCFSNFFPPTEFFKKLVYIRIRLILVVTKNLKKIHRSEAKILAHEVGKYEKVTVD